MALFDRPRSISYWWSVATINVSILMHRFGYITTFTVHLTVCDLKKSFHLVSRQYTSHYVIHQTVASTISGGGTSKILGGQKA